MQTNDRHFTVTSASHSAFHIKINESQPIEKSIQHLVAEISRLRTQCYSLYVDVHESQVSFIISSITALGFKFYKYSAGYLSYYIWCHQTMEDKVPEHATSIGGVHALVLSPDETELLLVEERQKWKGITGGVPSGAEVVQQAITEIREEVGLEVDPTWHPICLGTWQINSARQPGNINDNHPCFLFKANSRDFQVDNVEIHVARWFSLQDLYRWIITEDLLKAPLEKQHGFGTVDIDGQIFSLGSLMFLSTWFQDKGLGTYHNGRTVLVAGAAPLNQSFKGVPHLSNSA